MCVAHSLACRPGRRLPPRPWTRSCHLPASPGVDGPPRGGRSTSRTSSTAAAHVVFAPATDSSTASVPRLSPRLKSLPQAALSRRLKPPPQAAASSPRLKPLSQAASSRRLKPLPQAPASSRCRRHRCCPCRRCCCCEHGYGCRRCGDDGTGHYGHGCSHGLHYVARSPRRLLWQSACCVSPVSGPRGVGLRSSVRIVVVAVVWSS